MPNKSEQLSLSSSSIARLMWESLKSYLKGAGWVAIAGLLAALLFPVVREIHQALDATIISRLSPSKLFLAVCGLSLGCLILGAFCCANMFQIRIGPAHIGTGSSATCTCAAFVCHRCSYTLTSRMFWPATNAVAKLSGGRIGISETAV